MTDWKMIAAARGQAPDEKVTGPLEKLEKQFSALRADIALETEPAIYYVLQASGEDR